MRHMNGFYDDVFSSASGAASTMANDVQSFGTWVGQEFQSLTQSSQDYAQQQMDNTPNPEQDYLTGALPSYDLTQIPSDIGHAIEDNLITPVENMFGNAVTNLLMIGAGAIVLYALVNRRWD